MSDDRGGSVTDVARRFSNAQTYHEYEEGLRVYDETPLPAEATADDRAHKSYASINLQRASRISRSYVPGEEITAAVHALPGTQLWGVLSEVWCGDSAQIIPYLARIAALRADITFRVMARDENPDIMDRYLTDGKRCIPKFIVWDADGKELYTWGPRPAGAQAVIDEALAAGVPKEERLERLHLWYGRDRGKGIEGEIAALLRGKR
jgi:hypothetical protein